MSISFTDQRISELIDWLQNGLNLDIQQLEAASSDASFRRYFRVTHSNGHHIVMDAPPQKENTTAFLHVAELLRQADLHIPIIYHKNIAQGFLLLEDLGSSSLLDCLSPASVDGLYRQALDSVFKLQTGINIHSCELPVYDSALLQRELNIFYEWFLEKRLALMLPESIKHCLQQLLIDSALEQPRVCVHRDFHSRNLMVTANDTLGIIDFQDAVIGPICYDLVSLLRDCYISWPNSQVELWLNCYYQRLLNAKLLDIHFKQFKRWFDLMGLQRHLKAIGIFSRLDLRDDKSGYLADIPRTMAYISDICEIYPELVEFNFFLQHQILPIYRATL